MTEPRGAEVAGCCKLPAKPRQPSPLPVHKPNHPCNHPTPTERWEALQREQRQLLFACTESADAAASQLVELCALVARSSGSGGGGSVSSGGSGGSGGPAEGGAGPLLGLDDLVLLVLTAYCLLPDFLPW